MTEATASIAGSGKGVRIATALAGSGSRVDVRSVSRVGKGDFGVNTKRIRKFMQQLAIS